MAMTEMALSTQQQTAKPKVKEKKPSSAHSHSSGTSAKGRNVVDRRPSQLEVDMARQDLAKIAHPDTQRPFSSLADACDRLLPYHILAEYDVEECEEKEGMELLSRSRAWEESLRTQTLEFMATLEKQVVTYNTIIKKRSEGSMRGEERMMVEQSFLSDEKQKLMNVRAQIEAKDKAEKEAAEAKAKEAAVLAERARAEEQARAEAQAQAEAARFEAESKAEALRAGADTLPKVENQVKPDTSTSAAQSSGAVNVLGKSGTFNDGSWPRVENEDEDLEEEDDEDGEDLEGVWDEEGDVDEEDDDEDDSDSLET
ncbi:hypothetical protein MPTK1_8g03900 [Marchantia polymorpha subsp. ruderalis]|uniref:GLTSCR protein conserved domain-containing protein n=1 Tax=Marchantia polymorpha TaxID=3197 RepID=A0A2R6XJG2_MARPO|nr:hypothetical protein MARPO_0012s0180 [Marchantia polymorpha]BBN18606.1 hypothetical protein Mp_8g03900 [Marchantia polymorpha subsp. ruderalis]|eukprot:PTQ46253.1 hypothetical protein MARPO_0012s0180 [Marchantia polymorpha]